MNTLQRSIVFTVTILTFICSTAQARSSGASQRLLTVGGGISAPASTADPGENPAGLIGHSDLLLNAGIFSQNDDFSPLGLAGRGYFGNGSSVGLRLGYEHFSENDQFDLGLAAHIESLGVAFGTSIHLPIGSNGLGTDVDLGLMFNPTGRFRVGALARGVNGGVNGWGLGLATPISNAATFSIDGSVNEDFEGLQVLPAIGIHLAELQLSVGYGIEIDDERSSFLGNGLTLGLGFHLGSVHIESYYNHLAQYVANLAFRF